MEKSGYTKAYGKIRGLFHRELYGYKTGIKDMVYILASALALTGLVAYLFYNSVYAMGLIIFVFLAVYVFYFSNVQKRRLERIKTEFREVLLSVANGLSAGSSVERTFAEAEENLKLMYKNEAILLPMIHELNQRVKMGVAVEKQFYAMASNSRVEEIETFGELFVYAKRMGGDYVKNIRKLSLRMDEKIGMKEEMESQLAEKMLELRIMAVIPMGILLYLRLSAASFLTPLYANIGGVLVMTGCLFIYVGSIWLGIKIIQKTLEV